MTITAISDRELWERACAGDPEAFGVIFDRHSRAIFNYLSRRTASWVEAEDLTSVVFLQAWRHRSAVTLDRDSALPWLLGIARNTAANGGRARRRYQALKERLPTPSPVPDHAQDVADRVDEERVLVALRGSVARLPAHEREVIELCVWSGLDHQAAATALGVAVGTIKSRLHRARRRLGDDLREHAPSSRNTHAIAEETS
ncbi:RNA polymerase sigma factor [Embleya sp. MST-111070]|uniref:RNA polymerase sigma factor n=1 Tax=Embleya sp. MST-111070 TaxID=3398231 RepID=UPI003F736413